MDSWIVDEVLPSIRRSGKYSVHPQVEDQSEALHDSLTKFKILGLVEDLISKRIFGNKRARLSLALEAKEAMGVFVGNI